MSATHVDVFADVVCPFAHVGLRRFVDRRAQFGLEHPRLRVRAWPLELVNGEPFDSRHVADRVAALRAQVASDLFRHFTLDAVPSTSLPAFALAAEAYAFGDHLGESVSLALRNALFEDGRDISDPAVLADIAASHHLGAPSDVARRVYQDDYDEGRRRGVQGSPHFFVDDHDYFCPTLRIERIAGELSIAAAPDRLEALLADCFASPDGS
jgi:predicted DsbA family dithiol-disulfide isomerase